MKKKLISLITIVCLMTMLTPLGVAGGTGTTLSEAQVKTFFTGGGYGKTSYIDGEWSGDATRADVARACAVLAQGKAGADAYDWHGSGLSISDIGSCPDEYKDAIHYCVNNDILDVTRQTQRMVFDPSATVFTYRVMDCLLVASGQIKERLNDSLEIRRIWGTTQAVDQLNAYCSLYDLAVLTKEAYDRMNQGVSRPYLTGEDVTCYVEESPTLTVGVAMSGGGQAPTDVRYEWYEGRLTEDQIAGKATLPPQPLCDTASYTISQGNPVGTYEYTARVQIGSNLFIGKVFTLLVQNVKIESPTAVVNGYEIPYKVNGGGEQTALATCTSVGTTSNPAAQVKVTLPGGTKAAAVIENNQLTGLSLEVGAAVSGTASNFTIDSASATDLLQDLDVASQIGAAVGAAAGGSQVAVSKNLMPQLDITPAGTEAENVTSISVVTDAVLLNGLAAREGTLTVGTETGSVALNAEALAAAATAGTSVTIGVEPAADLAFTANLPTGAALPGTLQGTGLNVTLQSGGGAIDLGVAGVTVLMPRPQDVDPSILTGVHVKNDGALELTTYGENAAALALLDNMQGADIMIKNGWYKESPVSGIDSGWRYYRDDVVVTGGIVEGNYYYFTGSNGQVLNYLDRKTPPQSANADFVPPTLGISGSSCSPFGQSILEWKSLADTSWYNTTATSFTLNTNKELAGLAAIVNGTATAIAQDSFEEKNITLGNNIDLSGGLWTPIGTEDYSFKGVFDGNNKTISNMTILTSNSDAKAGLFGKTDRSSSGTTIRNLTVSGTVTAKGGRIGGIVGNAKFTHIENCHSKVNISASGSSTIYAGGITGDIAGVYSKTIIGCTNSGAIDVSNTNIVYAGGIAGRVYCDRIYNSYNTGAVTAAVTGESSEVKVGGIAGCLRGEDGELTGVYNSYNRGTVQGTGGTVTKGGVVGYLGVYTSVRNCYAIEGAAAQGEYWDDTANTKTAAELKALGTALNSGKTAMNTAAVLFDQSSGETEFCSWYASSAFNDGYPCFEEYIPPTYTTGYTPIYRVTPKEDITGGSVEISNSYVVSGGKTVITVLPKEGFTIEDVLINGVSVGPVLSYVIEPVQKDIVVEARFTPITDEKQGDEEKKLIHLIENNRLVARSRMSTLHGQRAVLVRWFWTAGTFSAEDFDGFEIMRSENRFSGYGSEPYFTTDNLSYRNNKDLEDGTRYYYKVRGWKTVNGKKVYTPWSLKAWRMIWPE